MTKKISTEFGIGFKEGTSPKKVVEKGDQGVRRISLAEKLFDAINLRKSSPNNSPWATRRNFSFQTYLHTLLENLES